MNGDLYQPRIRATLWNTDRLPMARAFMHGPKWKRYFDVRRVPITEVVPTVSVGYYSPKRKVLVFTFEPDVRELVLEELRPGVVAEWSDPRERLPQERPRAPPGSRS